MSTPIVTITVTPNPLDVIPPNNYTYNVVIEEYPINLTDTFDSTTIDFSSDYYTMDHT